jgi:hypothetical protein
MRFHWIQSKQKDGIFNILWAPGKYNLADYFTKVLPTKLFSEQRSKYVTTPAKPSFQLKPKERRRLEYVKKANLQLHQDLKLVSKGVLSKLTDGAPLSINESPLYSISHGPLIWEPTNQSM